MMKGGRWWLYLLMAGLLVVAAALLLARDEPGLRAQVVVEAAGEDIAGYARAEGPRPFDFPTDFGPHPDYQTEWWYYTGNLDTSEGRHFGYQFTVFRRAIAPPDQRYSRVSSWATDQIYMAHVALVDVDGEEFHAFERFSRGAAGLAGAQAQPYRVWLEDWQVEEVAPGVTSMEFAAGDVALNLTLTDRKGPVLQGDGGYSQKGSDPGNASYYYSLTRLVTEGTVSVGGRSYDVSGLSWKDHEYSTRAMDSDQVGWDWFALQLDDGTELMVAQLRRADGSTDRADGTHISADGSAQRLSQAEFTIEVRDTWRSPHSGGVYPASWRVSVPDLSLVLEVEPYLADQEINLSTVYWEGAVRVRGFREGVPVSGSGYVELTGYAQAMQGRF